MGNKDELLKYFRENKDFMDERIKSGIEQNRKGYAGVLICDSEGNPLKGAKVKINLKNHEFKHGANLFMLDEFESEEKNQVYKEQFKKAFNLATLPFFWRDLEPVKGQPRYAKNSPKIYRRPAPDLCLEYCEQNNIEAKGHCLVYIYHNPDWIEKELHKAKSQIDEHIKELAERYKDRIPKWEVVNETIRGAGWLDKAPIDIAPDLIEWSFFEARKYFPGNELIINEASGVWKDLLYNRSHYYMLIERAIRNGAKIDTAGIQYHMFYKPEELINHARTYYNPRMLYEVMDEYEKLGVNLQVTETTIPAYTDLPEDEELQAEIIKNLYSIWFSHRAMNGIIYWNLVDGYCYTGKPTKDTIGMMNEGENSWRGGLIRHDMTPKPAFDVICDLFNKEWHTEGEYTSDDDGMIRFKGFFGEYDVQIIYNGKKTDEKLEFLKGGTTRFKIKID